MGCACNLEWRRHRGIGKRLAEPRIEFLIELSFALGIPASKLSATLPEWWFRAYMLYATKKLLPHRRTQMQLAQLCAMTMKANSPSSSVSVADFMFEETLRKEQTFDDDEGDDIAALHEELKFNPRPRYKPPPQEES